MESNKIYNEDCMETMNRMDEDEVDLVLTDPPYGIKKDGGMIGGDNLTEAKNYSDKDWDSEPINDIYISKFREISDNQIVFGGNYFDLPQSSCWLVWDKKNTGNFADCELVWTSFEKAVRKYEWKWNGMLQEDMKNKEERVHPTQKPAGLIKMILQDWAEDYWTIYDPFTGSGSIPLACEELGYEWIASEKDDDYVEKARKRIKRERDQCKLV